MSDTISIREKLKTLIYAVPYKEQVRSVLFVSTADTHLVGEALEAREYGDGLHDEFLRKGLISAFPLYSGVVVAWYATTTELKPYQDLSKEELLFVLDNQKRQIDHLYSQRQRL